MHKVFKYAMTSNNVVARTISNMGIVGLHSVVGELYD